MFKIPVEYKRMLEEAEGEQYETMQGFDSMEGLDKHWIRGDRVFVLVSPQTETAPIWILARTKRIKLNDEFYDAERFAQEQREV